MYPIFHLSVPSFQDPLFYKKILSSKPALITAIAIGILLSLGALIALYQKFPRKTALLEIETSLIDLPIASEVEIPTAPPVPTGSIPTAPPLPGGSIPAAPPLPGGSVPAAPPLLGGSIPTAPPVRVASSIPLRPRQPLTIRASSESAIIIIRPASSQSSLASADLFAELAAKAEARRSKYDTPKTIETLYSSGKKTNPNDRASTSAEMRLKNKVPKRPLLTESESEEKDLPPVAPPTPPQRVRQLETRDLPLAPPETHQFLAQSSRPRIMTPPKMMTPPKINPVSQPEKKTTANTLPSDLPKIKPKTISSDTELLTRFAAIRKRLDGL